MTRAKEFLLRIARHRRTRLLVPLLPLLLLGATPARCALTLQLSATAGNAALGTTLVFSGTLTNTSPSDQVLLNDVQFTVSGSAAGALAFQSNTFFSNVPGILLPAETYSGPL